MKSFIRILTLVLAFLSLFCLFSCRKENGEESSSALFEPPLLGRGITVGAPTFLLDRDSGAFTLSHRVVGEARESGNLALTERVSVNGVDMSDRTFLHRMESIRTSDDTETLFTFEARESGIKSMTVTYTIYDGEVLLYEGVVTDYVNYYASLEELSVIAFGDSYFDDPSVSGRLWIDMMAEKYDMTLYNHGVSMSTASNYAGLIRNPAHQYCGSVSAYRPMCERFDEGAYKQLPIVDVDIVLFDAGRNDFAREVPLGELCNADGSLSTDTATYYGAVNSILARLKKQYPNALIIGVTCYNHVETNPVTGHTQVEFGEAMIAACEANGVPCFNNLDEAFTGVHMDDAAFKAEYCKSPTDFSHLNEKGMRMILPVWEKFLSLQCEEFFN